MATADESPSRRLDLWALAFAFLSVAAQGHRFGVGNQEILIPQVRRFLDPLYLANDWSLNGDTHHPLLTAGLAVATKVLGEPLAFLAAHLATRFLLLAGMHRLCRALVPQAGFAACLAAMLLAVLEPRVPIGGHYLQGGQFEGAFLGMAAAVWTLSMGTRWIAGEARWWKFAVAAGFAILLHLFIGLPAMAVVLLAAVAKRREAILREAAMCCGLAAAIGAPSLVPAARGFLSAPKLPIPDDLVLALLEARHPHHHMPWTWPVGAWFELAGVLAVCGIALRRAGARMAVPATLLAWYVATGALFWYCAWRLVAPAVVYFQAFRLTGLLLAVGACGVAVLAEGFAARRRGWWIAAAVVLVASFRVPPAFVVAGIAALAAAWKHPLPAPIPFPRSPRIAVAFAAVGAVAVATLQFASPVRNIANAIHREHWRVDCEPADPDRRAVGEWIRRNTAPDDILLVPVDSVAFRTADRRAIVVDLKFVPFTNAALSEWGKRILPLLDRTFADDGGFREAVIQWRNGAPGGPVPDATLDELAELYGAAWIVTSDGRPQAPGAAFASGPWSIRRAR